RIAGDISADADAAKAVDRGEPPPRPPPAVLAGQRQSEAPQRTGPVSQTGNREREEDDPAKADVPAIDHPVLSTPEDPAATAPRMATGDVVRLAQVFANVFANAAKYTPPGGQVVVSTAIENDWVVVACRDNGIGMGAELLPRVFDLFVQGAPDANRHQGGLGLGLALVRALVVQHGGTIEAHSDGPGKGSDFTIRLLLVRMAAPERILSGTSSSKEA